jgi:hypothetical protein
MKPYLFICLLYLHLFSPARNIPPGYHLDEGKRYTLVISVQQNTFSEAYNSGSEISLDQKMTLHFDILSKLDDETYSALVSYDNLFLSMLAPSMNIDINTGTGRNKILESLIDSLESQSFRIHLNRNGSIIMLDDINSFFFRMYDHILSTEEEQDVTIKTLREAYGQNAFSSIANTFINLYPSDHGTSEWEKSFDYYFNTKPVRMTNRFLLVKQTKEKNTIQGMGMIETTGEIVETSGNSTFRSSASGSQTFDLHTDPSSGWLKYGVSRQRILIKTTIIKDSFLPEGLEIPSYAETVFNVEGKMPATQ